MKLKDRGEVDLPKSFDSFGNLSTMNPGWLVESASLWGYHGAMMADTDQALHADAVSTYWIRNRVRFDAWNELFAQIRPWIDSPRTSRRVVAWSRASDLIEEVLLAEPLGRVSAVVALRLEERQVDSDSRAILHNVFATHQDIRKRSLHWILEGLDAGVEAADRLNRLRAYLEHWTDMLIGFFADSRHAPTYAFSSERVYEFAEDYSYRSLGDASETVWSLLLAGNRKWINQHCTSELLHPQLSKDVVQAALGMVHPRWFDSLGVLPSKAAQSVSQGLNFVDRTIESLVDGSWELGSRVQSRREGRFSA